MNTTPNSLKHIPTIPRELLTLLGKLFSLARKNQKWRQVDLAKRLGITRQTVARMEKGDPTIAVGVYFSAAWMLDVPILAGMDPSNTKTQDVLTKLITYLTEALPQRTSTPKEKPVDDNF